MLGYARKAQRAMRAMSLKTRAGPVSWKSVAKKTKALLPRCFFGGLFPRIVLQCFAELMHHNVTRADPSRSSKDSPRGGRCLPGHPRVGGKREGACGEFECR